MSVRVSYSSRIRNKAGDLISSNHVAVYPSIDDVPVELRGIAAIQEIPNVAQDIADEGDDAVAAGYAAADSALAAAAAAADAVVAAGAVTADAALMETDTVKTLRISALSLQPRDLSEGDVFTIADTFLTIRQNESGFFRGAAILPKGVTVTKLKARLRLETDGAATVVMFKPTGDETSVEVATVAASSNGWTTVEDTLSEVVGDDPFAFLVTLVSGGGATASVGILWIELQYTSPTLVATV